MNWAEFIAECIPAPATITVEAYSGSGAYGDVYADPVEVTPCVVQDSRRRVRVQTGTAAGAEVISETTAWCPPGTTAPAGSRITLASGRITKVIVSADITAAGHDLPEHVDLALE